MTGTSEISEPGEVTSAAELPEAITLIGGEMELWGDTLPAACPCQARLVEQFLPAGSDLLLAGVHARDVVESAVTIVGAGKVTVLVRGQRDAELLAAGWPGLSVWCGDLERVDLDTLRGGDRFGAVIALNGLEVLNSADAELRTWRRNFDRVVSLVRPDGALLLGVANPLSVATLAAATTREADDSDAAWSPHQGYDHTRPRSLEALSSLLAEALPAHPAAFAAYPTATMPRVLYSDAATLRPPASSVLSSLLVKHAAEPAGPYRLDPATLTAKAVAAGLARELAPGWVVSAGSQQVMLPAGSAFVHSVADGSARGRALDPTATLATGRLLEPHVLDLCVAEDLPAIRSIVEQFSTWLATPAGARRANRRFDNLVLDEAGDLHVLDDEDVRHGDAPDPLLDSVHAFARRLLETGWRNPFPRAAGADEVTTILAASVGHDVSASQLSVLARGETDLVVAANPDTVARLTAENVALRSKVDWFETAVRQRDKQLAQERDRAIRPDAGKWRAAKKREAKLQYRIRTIESSRAYRLSRAIGRVSGVVRHPGRLPRGVARRLRTRWRGRRRA